MVLFPVIKRPSGIYEERLDEIWMAEYCEDRGSGLWRVDVYHHNVPVWRAEGYHSIEEARQAARVYYDQQ